MTGVTVRTAISETSREGNLGRKSVNSCEPRSVKESIETHTSLIMYRGLTRHTECVDSMC